MEPEGRHLVAMVVLDTQHQLVMMEAFLAAVERVVLSLAQLLRQEKVRTGM